MPKIYVTGTVTPGRLGDQPFGNALVVVQVVTVSTLDQIFALHCSGDQIDQCPGDLEPGDTWSDFHAVMDAAVAHVEAHEARSTTNPQRVDT